MVRKRIEVPQMRGVQDLLSMEIEQPSATAALAKIQLPHKQPRRWFDPEKMAHLVKSVEEHGILEPLLVRPLPNGTLELVAGERRFRAAQEVGLSEVPIVVKELDDRQALQVALLENLQREDLNPIEETEGILELLAIALNANTDSVISLLNQSANAKKRGQDLTDNVIRQFEQLESVLSTVGRFSAESFRANRLPLLNLPPDILAMLRQGKLEYTKARAIARVKDEQQCKRLLETAIAENLSLSEIREKIRSFTVPVPTRSTAQKEKFYDRLSTVTQQLRKAEIWRDTQKRKQAEKLLAELEKLADESQ